MSLEVKKTLGEVDDYMKSGRGPSQIFSPKPGSNRIRLLPAGFLPYSAHFLVDFLRKIEGYYEEEEGEKPIGGSVTCLSSYDKDCPVCELSGLYYKSPAESDKEKGRSLYRSARFVCCVIDRGDNGSEVPVKIWTCGVTVKNQLLALEKKYGDPADPETGYDLIINLSSDGNSRNNKYTVEPLVAFKKDGAQRTMSLVASPLTPEEKAFTIPEMSDYVPEPDEGQLEKLFGPLISEARQKLEELSGGVVTKPVLKAKPVVPASEAKSTVSAPEAKPAASEPPKTKAPRCFGTFDGDDLENCANCDHRDACAKATAEAPQP